MTGIDVAQAHGPTNDVGLLIGELEAELLQHYRPEQRHGLTLDALFQPHIRFFTARLDGRPVGCGGNTLLPAGGVRALLRLRAL